MRPVSRSRAIGVGAVQGLAFVSLLAGIASARELPARIVVLDERSPHLELVVAVRDAFAEQLDALSAPAEGGGLTLQTADAKESSPEGILMRLTKEVLAGNLELPSVVALESGGAPDNADPLVAAVAGELDLEAGAFITAYEGTVFGIGQMSGTEASVPVISGPAPQGTCSMPAVMVYPSVMDSRGLPRRRPRAAWAIDTTLCQYFVPTAREIRSAKLYKRNVEERSVRRGTGYFFNAAEPRPVEGVQADGSASPQGLFQGCAILEYYNCGSTPMNRYAQLFSRIHNAFGDVGTNTYVQHHWRWEGGRSLCANVGGRMYDRVFIDGPDLADLRWEPRECGRGSGDHALNEYCPGNNRCPLQWQASSLAPSPAFDFWGVGIGFHRLHSWIPAGSPIPGGVYHGYYHWTRSEYLVEPSKAFFKKIACGAGGDYGRGWPAFQFHTCHSRAG